MTEFGQMLSLLIRSSELWSFSTLSLTDCRRKTEVNIIIIITTIIIIIITITIIIIITITIIITIIIIIIIFVIIIQSTSFT